MMKLPSNVVVLDTETTGLDLNLHDVWEVAYAFGEGPIMSELLPHTLQTANATALEMNGYWKRMQPALVTYRADISLPLLLKDKTIVGANPAFDMYRLEKRWGKAPWHYRLVDVESMAVSVLDLDKPLGLKGLVDELTAMGYTIPENDHTAAGDVATTREVYRTLRDMGKRARSN